MKVRIRGADEGMLPPHVRETIVTVGTFDGVHRGHLDVLARLAERARATGRASLLLTFEPHPLELLHPARAPRLLTTRDEKLAAVAATGLHYVAILPFTRELANHSAEEFVDLVLRGRFQMAELLIGHDHGFGRGRAGDVETLQTLGAARGFAVDVVAPVETSDGQPVSSTRIRQAVLAGDLETAEAGLGRHYSVAGEVVPGEARGREFGYPTLNLVPESPRKLLPPDGVYAVDVETPRGRFGGMMHLGPRPTFGDERRTMEAHLFDATGDYYGDVVQVGFVARLRETRRFDGSAELMKQLTADEEGARRALTLLAEPGSLKGSTRFLPSTP
jgi:riboflavin kinase/FMN adenylyltransferase